MFRNIGRLLISGFLIIGILTVTAPAKAVCHGRNCATSREISPNSVNHGVLTDSSDVAVYRVALDHRGLIDVWTDPGSFTVWDIELLDASCVPASGSVENAMLYADDREMYRIHISQPVRVHAFTTGPSETRTEPVVGLYFSDCSSGFDQEFADERGNGLVSSLLEPGTYYLSVEPFRGDLLTPFTLHMEYVNDRNR
jgi:hypothetical protein